MKIKNNLIYLISKYFSILKLLLGFNKAFLIVNNHKIYFNNFNFIGIFESAYKEMFKLKEIYESCDCYIDVGSHMGAKSFWFNYINPRAKIIAFEPNPETFSFLESNLSHVKNINLFNLALGDKNAELLIHFDKDHLDTASLNKDSFYLKNNAKGSISNRKVPIKKLDEYIELVKNNKNIYLKFDVETYEEKLLKGATKILDKAKYLEIEIYQDTKNTLSDKLSLLPKKFNIITCSFLKPSGSIFPNVVNILLEFI